jgi:hypothetical protein
VNRAFLPHFLLRGVPSTGVRATGVPTRHSRNGLKPLPINNL